MLNITQLKDASDTMNLRISERSDLHLIKTKSNFRLFGDSLLIPDPYTLRDNNFLESLNKKEKESIYSTAISLTRSQKTYLRSSSHEISNKKLYNRKFLIEWHRKFAIGASCIVLFLIGAPLGAIIRKGGLGLPVVISVLGFMVNYISMMVGEKMAKQGALSALEGMWLAIFILTPIGVFLTYKATTDSAVMDASTYTGFIRKTVDQIRLKIKVRSE